jgi:hypothetical protein
LSAKRRTDRIDREPCPRGKFGHRAYVHKDGVRLICRDKAALKEPGEWACAM